MDEEDLIDSRKKFRISKVHNNRFKIDFLWIFIICVILMIADQIMKYIDIYPELFYRGDCFFHILQSAIAICAQLSVSVAAAVIFYYVLEFINAKKRLNDLTEIRKYLLFILYGHMNIVCNTESFKELNRNKKRLEEPKLFLIVDVPIFWSNYNIYDKKTFEKELSDYFYQVHEDAEIKRLLLIYLKNFQEKIESLLEYKRFSFYKNYMQDIEDLQSLYTEIKEYAALYQDDNDAGYLHSIIDYYISFFDDCVNMYHITERYVECLEERHFMEFIKLMG